jgi:mono/diheme cytochrome c family protein
MGTIGDRMRRALVAMLAVGWFPALVQANDGDRLQFGRDVRPILARHCFACHGPDEASRKADLRLDVAESAVGPQAGMPFVAGDLEASSAIERILSDDPDLRMPPGDEAKRMPPEEVAILKQWVAQGAAWESHWSFVPPHHPDIAVVEDPDWNATDIDRLLYPPMRAAGLNPSAQADPATRFRRVALDLTGLPPTPEQVDAFLADPSAAAYEQWVDELLESPHYGERMARIWLDLARYADTKGYEKDQSRNIWRYRDWLIDAFNHDLPYDQFTIEQLAGDLLPNPTPSQRLATAFNRNTLVNEEGGTDDEEFRIAAVKDRVDTTMQVWMGITAGCAKCHTHKYDPISIQDYYRLFAFFNQTADADRGDDSPTAVLPDERVAQSLAEMRRQRDELEQQMHQWDPIRADALEAWIQQERQHMPWRTLVPQQQTAASGSTFAMQADGSTLVVGPATRQETYIIASPITAEPLSAIRLEVIPDPSHRYGSVGRGVDGNIVLSGFRAAVVRPGQTPEELEFVSAEADYSQDGYPVHTAIENSNPRKYGWGLAPKQKESHRALFRLGKPIQPGENAQLVITLDHQFQYEYPGFSIGRFRLGVTSDPEPNLTTALSDELFQRMQVPSADRSDEDRLVLLRDMVQRSPQLAPQREELAKLSASIQEIEQRHRTPVMEELPGDQHRVTKVHIRGNFLQQGDEVQADAPQSFHPFPVDAPRDRLGFAKWIVDPANPLTSRVAVNRVWAMFFGIGLVESQEDFGSQGIPPSHPELLDYLAVTFVRDGWSHKKLCKQIVLSQAYQQSSAVSNDASQRDPRNRWISRFPRTRLEAELLRDNVLSIAGLLSRKRYGPSVMPRQPDGIWRSTYNATKWELSQGEDAYRRGLYTYLKRSSPYPAAVTLDGTSRELCTIRRINTNTPLQALVTLNDPVFVEAAQALARRVAGQSTSEACMARAFKLATLRSPRPAELATLTQLYEQRLQVYAKDPQQAQQIATDPIGPVPEGMDVKHLAALTAVCNVILNLDEVLTQH